MSSLISKLAFNGFHVVYWSHEDRIVDRISYPTIQSVLDVGFTNEEFPQAVEFAEGLFDVYGDCVGKIKDNLGQVLYDNMVEMKRMEDLL